jgi:hypothetical protein
LVENEILYIREQLAYKRLAAGQQKIIEMQLHSSQEVEGKE